MMHKHTKTDSNRKSRRLLHTPAPPPTRGPPSPQTHTTQHTSLFGARRLRQRLCLLPRCLLLLRLLSRCSLLIRLLLCSRCLCLCFCSSRLSNAPTSQLQSQFSCTVLPGNANGHFLSCKSVSIVHRDTGKNFKMVFQLRLFP